MCQAVRYFEHSVGLLHIFQNENIFTFQYQQKKQFRLLENEQVSRDILRQGKYFQLTPRFCLDNNFKIEN